MRTWLLPEYIEDILPAEAARIERLRRDILDLFVVHGYELVMPPLLEYLESLLTGTGHDLDLQTFKLVDQLSGRMLGVRADITPQVARIDAHLLNRKGVTRLCYAGSVLHTLPRGMNRTREPLQIGAELYGHAGIESDVEIQRLMMSALAAAGVARCLSRYRPRGDVPLPRARGPASSASAKSELFRAMQAKDVPALRRAHAQAGRSDARRPRGVARALWRSGSARGGAASGCRTIRRSGARSRDLRGARPTQLARRRAHPLLRSGGAARLPLSQRRRVRGLCRGPAECDRARRPLRRGRQGVRPRAAGDRIQHGPARARAG